MKRFLFLLSSVLIFNVALAVNPIPSYYTTVSGSASFAEVVGNMGTPTDERRDMEVSSSQPNTLAPGGYAIVYMYRMDGSRTLGPFYLPEGGSIRQKIDGKPWGCSVRCDGTMLVSVWTTVVSSSALQLNLSYLDYNENNTDSWGISDLI